MTDHPAPTPSDASTEPVAAMPGLPSRIDVRRAFDVYVYGRNRTLGPAQKRAAVPEKTAGSASGAGALRVDGHRAAPVNVAVPQALRFDRNAGTWRDGLESTDMGGT